MVHLKWPFFTFTEFLGRSLKVILQWKGPKMIPVVNISYVPVPWVEHDRKKQNRPVSDWGALPIQQLYNQVKFLKMLVSLV